MSYMSLREEDSFQVQKSKKHGNRKNRKSAAEQSEKDQDWELVPSSSFSDWKLEQNPISGFLTLIKNFVSGHTINLEQLMRGGGVAIIGKNHYIIRVNLRGVQGVLLHPSIFEEDLNCTHQF